MTSNVKIYEKEYVEKLHIPDLITEEWLINQFNSNGHFTIYGFSNINLNGKKFDENISRETLRKITFNSNTIFPQNSPIGYDNSMLGVDDEIQKIHSMGLTGNGINIAVIDQPISSIHNEIKDSLISFNDNAINKNTEMHGTIVTSLLTGKNTGVAPNAKLHYFQVDAAPVDYYINGVVKSLEDIYKMNEQGADIKIVNVSGPIIVDKNNFYQPKVTELIDMLKRQGCYVIDSNIFAKSNFTCINKDYQNGEYYYSNWQEVNKNAYKEKIAIPTGGKLYPSPFGESDYWYKSNSTYSWAIPKLCGLFALCLEANPQLSYDEFVRISNETTITNNEGVTTINPVGIVEMSERINKTI